jgi:cell division ATPase FtsA
LIPQDLAETLYLISPEQRDGYAVLFDMGYISSTYTVACGNGVIFSEAFSVGIGHVAVLLMNELDIPYEVAVQFMGMVNLNAKEKLSTIEEYKYGGKIYSFSTVTLRDIIREGLDGICETIEECRQSFTGKDLSGKPLYITGEGVKTVRGTAEHLSSRLVTPVEIISPNLPYYDKPQFSSLFSLLAAALNK